MDNPIREMLVSKDQQARMHSLRRWIKLNYREQDKTAVAMYGNKLRVTILRPMENYDWLDLKVLEIPSMEELAEAALEASGAVVADALRGALDAAPNAGEGVVRFLDIAWGAATGEECAGCPIAPTALE